MKPKELFLAAFYGEAKERIPVYEQVFASDVASKILGYEAATGGAILHYQEALAGISGESAYREFIEKVKHDKRELHSILGFGAISKPWLRGRPTKQVSEFEFLYGDPNGYWFICRYNPIAKTYSPIAYSDPPIWRDEQQIKETVDSMWRAVERWDEDNRESFEREVAEWRQVAGDEFELVFQSYYSAIATQLQERYPNLTCRFQSHYGVIATVGARPPKASLAALSIPLWCD